MIVVVTPLLHNGDVRIREVVALVALATVATFGTYVVSIPRWVATAWRER